MKEKTDNEVLADIEAGYTIRIRQDEWHNEYYMKPPGEYAINSAQVNRLIESGRLESIPNGSGWRVARDDGRESS